MAWLLVGDMNFTLALFFGDGGVARIEIRKLGLFIMVMSIRAIFFIRLKYFAASRDSATLHLCRSCKIPESKIRKG